MVRIAGALCGGKSELARRLASALHTPITALDSYCRDLGHLHLEKRSRTNFNLLESLDAELLSAQLRSLSGGKEIGVDVRERGRTPESVFEQYQTSVGPIAPLHILPTVGHAGLVIDGADRLEGSMRTILAGLHSGSDKRKEVCLET